MGRRSRAHGTDGVFNKSYAACPYSRTHFHQRERPSCATAPLAPRSGNAPPCLTGMIAVRREDAAHSSRVHLVQEPLGVGSCTASVPGRPRCTKRNTPASGKVSRCAFADWVGSACTSYTAAATMRRAAGNRIAVQRFMCRGEAKQDFRNDQISEINCSDPGRNVRESMELRYIWRTIVIVMKPNRE